MTCVVYDDEDDEDDEPVPPSIVRFVPEDKTTCKHYRGSVTQKNIIFSLKIYVSNKLSMDSLMTAEQGTLPFVDP